MILIGHGVFSWWFPEKRPLPLEAFIADTELPCANALACDDSVQTQDIHTCTSAILKLVIRRQHHKVQAIKVFTLSSVV
jgi:hypothetical protein